MSDDQTAMCEDCHALYPCLDGVPETGRPYTCDDCSGAVEPITEDDE